MRLTRRTKIGLAGLLPAIILVLLASALPASAGTQRLSTGVYDDRDAKLSVVLQKDKKGKPEKV